MLTYYLALNLPLTASQSEIRRRYLDLVKAHPPSRDPDRFQQISKAYEGLKDRRSRIDSEIFGVTNYIDANAAIQEIAQVSAPNRKTPGLRQLLVVEQLVNERDGNDRS